MAANRTHLRNVDKSYALEPTDKKTKEGKVIYKNKNTGELHSELSVTLEYPKGSGKWINVPSLLNGRVYNAKGVLAMLKAGKLTPTSTHADKIKAIDAAQFRSNNLQNEGIVGQTLAANGGRGSFAGSSANLSMGKNPDKHHISRDRYADMAANAALESRENAYQNRATNLPIGGRGSFAGSSANFNLGVNQDKHHVSRDRYKLKELAAIMDRANAEKDDSYFYNPDDPDLNTPWKNWNAKYRMEDIIRGSGLKGAENPTMNRYTQTPVSESDQAMFDNAKEERRLLHMGKAMSSYGPRFGPQGIKTDETKTDKTKTDETKNDETKTKVINPYTKNSKKSNVNTQASANMDLGAPKNATLDYGKMPGFKFKQAMGQEEGKGYWSADIESPFWQTNAGYEKAMQTWGEKPGWIKHTPKRKEIDIEKIKSWFTPSK